jgi:hypothetical protein
MYRIVFFFLPLLLVSCGQEQQKNPIEFGVLVKSSEKYKEGRKESISARKMALYSDSLSGNYLILLDSLKVDRQVIKRIDVPVLPDRFRAESSAKFSWRTSLDSINFFHWHFVDSIRTRAAFYNWLDCFGPHCKVIRIGEEVNFQKRSTLLFVNERELILIDASRKIEQEKWVQILEELWSCSNWNYMISQIGNKKAKWFSVEKGVVYELNNEKK